LTAGSQGQILGEMDKARILAEIKRTAQSNGGTPLGVRAFHAETGLKESDWKPFWPRFSDAVREAGYAPNEFKKEGYEKAELLDHYAKLALKIGRLPTRNDLAFHRHNDPGFPSRKTFETLGTKVEVVKRLLDHCQNKKGFEAVIGLCKTYAIGAEEPLPEIKANDSQDGYVYLAKSGRFYKIGKTNAPGRRDYELAIQLPEKLSMVHLLRTDDPEGIEAYWHRRFSANRQNGEWFSLSPTDVAAFKRRKFM
jgi:Meiotically Up-regulated Gene 113 (MUG113) protein